MLAQFLPKLKIFEWYDSHYLKLEYIFDHAWKEPINSLDKVDIFAMGENLKAVLNWVFNFKLGSFISKQCDCMAFKTATSRIKNLAQVFILLADGCPWYNL